MRIIICDDILEDAEKANKILKDKYRHHSIEMMTPQDMLVAVEEDLLKCDIVILDIYFNDEKYDGIHIARRLNEKLPACQIIYLSAILDFAPDVYETRHCYFVMKDNMKIMLPRAVDKAENIYNEMFGRELVEFLSGGKKVVLAQKDIVYIERDNRILNIYTNRKIYPCYESLRKVEKRLSSCFARCHAGFIVNISYISGLEKEMCLLDDGKTLPIGKTFLSELKLKYLKYHSDRM